MTMARTKRDYAGPPRRTLLFTAIRFSLYC